MEAGRLGYVYHAASQHVLPFHVGPGYDAQADYHHHRQARFDILGISFFAHSKHTHTHTHLYTEKCGLPMSAQLQTLSNNHTQSAHSHASCPSLVNKMGRKQQDPSCYPLIKTRPVWVVVGGRSVGSRRLLRLWLAR
ncbi:hypothetical protein B0T17DRAFT_209962 [Bombardia bombarda]|uniref:Uncharacterized protein n=1 Tax=Bombardia bombarda TaxID=252184 RepID=A0AA39XA11_9PEZI|nr:hypothetical protein B0T17DRAFT_209962 [Bombardia bombarda]